VLAEAGFGWRIRQQGDVEERAERAMKRYVGMR
jgi:hypothetical protein